MTDAGEQRGKNWSIRWIPGEASDAEVAAKIFLLLDEGPRPESAKIYQGTSNGVATTYVIQQF